MHAKSLTQALTQTLILAALSTIFMAPAAAHADVTKDTDPVVRDTLQGNDIRLKFDKFNYLDRVCIIQKDGSVVEISDGDHKDIRHWGKRLQEAKDHGDEVVITVEGGEITGVVVGKPKPDPKPTSLTDPSFEDSW